MQHNLNPHIWGHHTWFFIESLVFSYPEQPNHEVKLKFKLFFENLILPCNICTYHYKKFIENNNIDYALKSDLLLKKWILSLHNSVNCRNNKK